jgi:hypothetical protein
MVKRLEIKRLSNANYKTLKNETYNFEIPVICTLNANDISTIQDLKTFFLDKENHAEITNENASLKEFSDKYVIDYSDNRWQDYKYSSFIFLTKDKIISPNGFLLDKHNAYLEKISDVFFTTSIFKEKLADTSIFVKLLVFVAFRRGIFGKFNWKNLSGVVNVNTWYSHGETNTFIHTDHALSNLFLQMEGVKRWWIASPYQRKEIIQALFHRDITTLNLEDDCFQDLEYYDIELQPSEILYVPSNWLHSVLAPLGVNLSLSFRYPMSPKEALVNILHWQSIGVPLNKLKKGSQKAEKNLAEIRAEQAESFNNLNLYLKKHRFATREIPSYEPETISGLYELDQLNKVVTGAE